VPSNGQVSNVLLVFISTVILSFETRRDHAQIFIISRQFACFEGGGADPSLRRVGSGFWGEMTITFRSFFV
jgi:hypothetical protein